MYVAGIPSSSPSMPVLTIHRCVPVGGHQVGAGLSKSPGANLTAGLFTALGPQFVGALMLAAGPAAGGGFLRGMGPQRECLVDSAQAPLALQCIAPGWCTCVLAVAWTANENNMQQTAEPLRHPLQLQHHHSAVVGWIRIGHMISDMSHV